MALGLSVRHETCLASNWLFYWLWALLSFPPEFPPVFRCHWQCPCTTPVNPGASEWYAAGCERVYGRRMQAANFPGVVGGATEMAEWLEARETARRHSRLTRVRSQRDAAKARVHRGPGGQGVPRSVASHWSYHFVEWSSIDGTIFFSISQTKIIISQTKILNEVVLIVLLFLSISHFVEWSSIDGTIFFQYLRQR